MDSLENSLESCVEAAKEAMNFKGPAVVVFKGKCVGITKSDKRYKIDPESCTGCGFCIKQLGCPALFLPAGEDKASSYRTVAAAAGSVLKSVLRGPSVHRN